MTLSASQEHASSYPARPHLTNCRFVRWDRVAKTDAARDALRAILGEFNLWEPARTRARKIKDQERLEAALESFVLELFWCAQDDPEMSLAYPRGTSEFGPGRTPTRITTSAARTVADFLQAFGFATGMPGSYMRKAMGDLSTGHGYRSRLRASGKLLALLDAHGVTCDAIGLAPLETTIRLRGAATDRKAAKPLLSYAEIPEVAAMRARVDAANALRLQARLELETADTCPKSTLPRPQGTEDGNAEEYVDSSDLAAVQLYRVFNNGSWEQGGRFYGGWWQRRSKAERGRILIDGEITVELDYKAFQPRLCYHLEGLVLPDSDDPHLVPGYGLRYREAAKRAFGQLLNSVAGTAPRRPPEFKKLFDRVKDYRDFLEALEASYGPVRAWLRKGRGLEMQYIDSQIADEVMHRLTLQGIPVLPIHDSFIVPLSAQVELGVVMTIAYRDILVQRTGTPNLPVIEGWSDPDVVKQVQERLTAHP